MLIARRACTRSLVALLALVSAAAPTHAQGALTVRGTVTRETLGGTRAVPRELVTLHRVSSREAGAVDSILTDAKGAFAFRVIAPDSTSMYLVSARYGGIAYFSQPMQGTTPSGPAEIIVYDTTSQDVRTQLQGRHLVVSSPNAAGVRSVIDVLEIENDTILTRVPGSENRPTYALLLPDGVTNVHASQGEISDGAVAVRNGRAELFAPLSPGLRQLVLTYDVEAKAFPLAVPLERSVSVMEVLLEEQGASASGAGLDNKGAVTVDGKTFTRYLGASSSDNAVVTISAGVGVSGGGIGGGVPPWLLPLLLTVITLGAILVLARRRPPVAMAAHVPSDATPSRTPSRTPSITPLAPHEAQELARQIAAVDALIERTSTAALAPARDDDGTGSSRASVNQNGDAALAREELTAYRARLKGALVDALARERRAR